VAHDEQHQTRNIGRRGAQERYCTPAHHSRKNRSQSRQTSGMLARTDPKSGDFGYKTVPAPAGGY
jgi:hypothetical protein